MKVAALDLPGADPITREMLRGDSSTFSEAAIVCARFDMKRARMGKPSGSVGLHLGVLA